MTLIQYDEIDFKQESLTIINHAVDIIAEYHAAGYTLSLRQLYYQFVARDLIPNTDRSYKQLGKRVADGRNAGLISWDAIEDRGRGPTEWLINEDPETALDDVELNLGWDHWERQGVYLEVWVEKDALSSVIRRPCQRWAVPYMACKGYLSVSEAWRSGQRFKAAQDRGLNCHMLHLGDHDPSGIDMTRNNDELLAKYSEGVVLVHRLALNRGPGGPVRSPTEPRKSHR